MSPEGLTVEQYAGISAAIADGYPLDAVLANEGLAPKAWPGEDTAWKLKLVDDPATFESYRAKLGEAEDWLGRKVTPLDDDLAAWMGFLGAYGAHQAPFDLLGGIGLGMGDLGRLQRRWTKRLATDDELAKQAAELAKTKPTALPKVSAAKRVLRPFPWSKKGAPVTAPLVEPCAETRGDQGDFDLAQYAALAAELASAPKERAWVLRRHDLDAPALAALHARWDARMAADSALAQDYRGLFAHHRARFESAARSGRDLPRSEAREPVRGPELAPHPDLHPTPIAAVEASIDAGTAPRRAPSKLAGTAMAIDVPREPALAVDVPRGPALPFDPGAAPSIAIAASGEGRVCAAAHPRAARVAHGRGRRRARPGRRDAGALSPDARGARRARRPLSRADRRERRHARRLGSCLSIVLRLARGQSTARALTVTLHPLCPARRPSCRRPCSTSSTR